MASFDHVPVTERTCPGDDRRQRRLLPSQLDRRRSRRRPAVSARHTRTVYKVDRKTGEDQMAARRQAERLHVRARRGVQLPARRAPPRRRDTDDLRQRRFLPGPGVEPFSRPMRLVARHEGDDRDARRRVPAPGASRRVGDGQRAAVARQRRVRRLGHPGAFTEFDRPGRFVLRRVVRRGSVTYRAFRSPWVGRPTGRPAVAAPELERRHDDRLRELERGDRGRAWRVRPGAPAGRAQGRPHRPRTGFETAIPVPGAGAYVAVAALDASGEVLGTSRAIRPS